MDQISTPVNYRAARLILHQITAICDGILLRAGPYHKEGLYQTLLIHELTKLGIVTTRERVFNMVFNDSEGKPVFVGDNQSLRTDIELIELEGIIELKSSGNSTKDDNIWQLRNYLQQRTDCHWGIVVNFISKFGTRTSPEVQCDLLFQINENTNKHEIRRDEMVMSTCDLEVPIVVDGIEIPKVWHESLIQRSYPLKETIFLDYDETIFEEVPIEKEVSTRRVGKKFAKSMAEKYPISSSSPASGFMPLSSSCFSTGT